MKQIITIIILVLFSCSVKPDEKFKTSKLELRQLVKETENSTSTSAFFFLIAGSYNKKEYTTTTVKMFAKVEGRYRLIECNIEEIRVVINNSLKIPYLEIEYDANTKLTDEKLLDIYYIGKTYIIYCPEQYLPEKLLPLEL
jgi:hypothetical protein